MQAKDIVVRVRSKGGTHRVQISPSSTVDQLKEKIAAQTSVPKDDQKLHLEERGRPGRELTHSQQTLISLGATNGQMFFLEYEGTDPNQTTGKKKLKDIKRKWDLKSYMDHLDSQGLIFKRQEESHCKQLSPDFNACNQFQLNCQAFAFQRCRIGLLYGNYSTDTNRVTVDVIYEPPQQHQQTEDGVDLSFSSSTFLLDTAGEEIAKADELAALLGYKRVGWVFSHEGEREHVFTSQEVVVAAEMQSRLMKEDPLMAKYFVTLKVFPTEDGMSSFEAYQLSDQAVKLQESGVLKPIQRDAAVCQLREEVLMHRAGAGRKDATEIDPTVLVVPVALDSEYQGALRADFPIENRPESPQTTESLKAYLLARKKTGEPFVKTLADFHLLLFLCSTYLDPKTDMPALCQAVQTGDTEVTEGFKLLIESFAGLM
ncbi:Nuclear pore localization protein NPL4 [Balamuthia mandrillaris]